MKKILLFLLVTLLSDKSYSTATKKDLVIGSNLYQKTNLSQKVKIKYDRFYNSEQIEVSIRTLAQEAINQNSSLLRANFIKYGKTYKGQPLNAIRIGLKANDAKTIPLILVDAGIHGNEWIGPATAHFIAESLLTKPKALDVLEHADVIIAHCVNRDSYDDSIKWFPIIEGRKNAMPSSLRKCNFKNKGTNINRNFDWFWNLTKSSEDPCGHNYRGDFPHSAPETRALVRLMNLPNVNYYHTIHSCGNVILYPYGNSPDPVKYFKENRGVALAGKEAVQKKFGVKYKVGSTIDVLYKTSGSSKDYAAGKVGIPFSMLHEIGERKIYFEASEKDIKFHVRMGWTVFYTQALEVNKYKGIL